MKMKKYFMAVCLLAAGTFALTSCGEKESIVTFNVNLEKPVASKGYIDGERLPHLVTGDCAYVNDGVFAFDFENGDPILRVNHASDNVYRAIFPAYIVDSIANPNIAHLDNVRVKIPQVQRYETENGVQKVDMPMISYPDGYQLWFKNICSIVKVNITNPFTTPVTLTNIQMLNNDAGQSGQGSVYLAGNTRVNVTSSEPVITVDQNPMYRSILLNFDTNEPDAIIAPGETRSYMLVVAPFENASGMIIIINTTAFSQAVEGIENVTELPRNCIANVNHTFHT